MHLVKSKLRAIALAVLCCATSLSICLAAQPKGKIKGVETQSLLDRPQDYWSVSIAFKDTATEISGRKTKLDGQLYTSVSLKELGTVYFTDDAIKNVEEEGLNNEFLLTGTVLHKTTGFFKKKDTYLVIVYLAVKIAISNPEEVVEGFDDLTLADDHPATHHIMGLFSTTQRELLNFAEEKEVPIEDLFNDDLEFSEEARDIVRRSLRKLEVTSDISSGEMLSGFMFYMLGKKLGAAEDDVPAETMDGDAVDEPVEEMDKDAEKAMADEPVDVLEENDAEKPKVDEPAKKADEDVEKSMADEPVMKAKKVVKKAPKKVADEKKASKIKRAPIQAAEKPATPKKAPVTAIDEVPQAKEKTAPPVAVKEGTEEPPAKAKTKAKAKMSTPPPAATPEQVRKVTSKSGKKKPAKEIFERAPIIALDEDVKPKKSSAKKASSKDSKRATLPVQTIQPDLTADEDPFAPVGK